MAESLQPRIDRSQLAINLRHAGRDADFETWDGLSDDQVISIVSHMHVVGFELPLEEGRDDEV